MMRRLVLFVMLSLFAFGSSAEVYKWTDSQGNTHFSDVPHDGAEKVDVPVSQSSPAPKPNTDNSSGSKASDSDTTQDSGERQKYTGIEITEPKNEETIHNKDDLLTIKVKVSPELYVKDKIQFLYDGTPIGEPQHILTFKLKGMNKGSHKIVVQVVDPDGNVLIASEPTTFFMQSSSSGPENNNKPANQTPAD